MGLLTHAKLLQQRLAVKLPCAKRLLIVLCNGSVLRLLSGQSLLKVLPNRLILHLLGGLPLSKILRDGLVDRLLRLLSRLERRQLRLAAKLACGQTLCKLLRLRFVGKLTRCQGLLRVLRDSAVASLLGLHPCAKAGEFCFLSKLGTGKALLERLLLRLVLCGLCGQSLLEVLTKADVVQPRLLHACAKARQGGLVSEHGA